MGDIYGTYVDGGRRYLNATIEGAVIEAVDAIIQADEQLGYEASELSALDVVHRINDALTRLIGGAK